MRLHTITRALILSLFAFALCIYTQLSESRTLLNVIEHPQKPPQPIIKNQAKIKEVEQDLQHAHEAYKRAQQRNEYYKNSESQTIQNWQSENDLRSTQQSIRDAEGNLYSAQRRAESELLDRKLKEQNLDTQKRRQNNILGSYPQKHHGRR